MKTTITFLTLAILSSLGNAQASSIQSKWSHHYKQGTGENGGLINDVVTTDSNNNIYFCQETGNNGGGMYFYSLDPSGVQRWVTNPDPNDNSHMCDSMATDHSGNLYVVGTVENGEEYTSLFVQKFSSSGNNLGIQTLSNFSGWVRYASISVDENGGIYILVNRFYEKSSLIKIDSTNFNQIIWENDLPGTDGFNSISTDLAGSVFLYQYHYSDGSTQVTPQPAYLTRFDLNGNKVWEKTLETTSVQYGQSSLKAGPNGSLYLSGTSTTFQPLSDGSGQTILENQIFLSQFSTSTGNQNWTINVAPPAPYQVFSQSGLAVDSKGNAYVAGQIALGSFVATHQLYISGFNARGINTKNTIIQTTTIDGKIGYPSTQLDNMTTDTLGNLIISGRTEGDIGNQPLQSKDFDYFIMKLKP